MSQSAPPRQSSTVPLPVRVSYTASLPYAQYARHPRRTDRFLALIMRATRTALWLAYAMAVAEVLRAILTAVRWG